MIPITFLPMNQKVDVMEGQSILNAALQLGIDINGACAGNGTCGKCRILVTKGNDWHIQEVEKKYLSEEQIKSGMRLGCKFCPTEEVCVVLSKETKIDLRNRVGGYRDLPKKEIGVVFDLGTTTVEMVAYDLYTKEKIIQIAKANPQKIGGGDVVSRIMYAMKEKKNLFQMQNLIYRCCNELLEGMLSIFLPKDREAAQKSMKKMIVTGNTTMSHLFLGKPVDGLAKAPFHSAFHGAVHLSNENQKFEISDDGDIMVLPNISGHVGSDTLGCIIAVDLEKQSGVQFILDIGTNGEMVLFHHGEMSCCSVAAGPALEGASIYQGMQAIEGAIKAVKLQDGLIISEVVGNQIAKGICGSGIIDGVSVMLEMGKLDKTGRIVDGEEWILYAGKENVVLTQHDIREIQLAKAAIYAGMITLLKINGLMVSDIDKFYLAGTFGTNINIENAKKIGLIPAIHMDKIELIGNGAIAGAGRILLEELSKIAVEESASKVKHVELADNESFKDCYIESMNF